MNRLIGIHGHAGSGKDTIAEYLELHAPITCATLAFADPLKDAAAAMFGISHSNFYDLEYKEAPNEFWGVSPRQIAQFFGTEMVRNQIHKLLPSVGKNFWMRRFELSLKDFHPTTTIVIPDVRFQNELDWVIQNNGIIIHLTRPGADGTVGIPNHSSEQELDTKKGNVYTIHNDSTLEALFTKVNTVLTYANFISQ